MKHININNLFFIVTTVFVLISCSGNQNDSTQVKGDDTGAVALQILFQRPADAERKIQSLDACDDVVWVRASVLDENDNVLVTGANWHCEAKSGVIEGVPQGNRRKVVVNGLEEDGMTVLYWGVSDFFQVSPSMQNSAGKVIAHHIDDVDQDGDGFTPNQNDCNDTDKTIHPDAKDLCNDEIDQDCDSTTCSPSVWYADRDGDSYGNSEQTIISVQCPDHYVADNTDCNDGNSKINAEAEEQCNGIDDDCDGIKDEGCPWNVRFDSGGDDTANAIVQTRDGGYAIAGTSISPDDGGKAVAWLIKTDEIGVRQWEFKFEGAGSDASAAANAVIQSDDGGIVIAGEADRNVWLAKIDESGNQIWNETFVEGTSSALIQTVDGGYVATGKKYSETFGDILLLKVDKNGNESWCKSFDKGLYDSASSVTQNKGSGYTVAGQAVMTISNKTEYFAFLLTTDEEGNETSNKLLEFDRFSNVMVTSMIQVDNYFQVVAGVGIKAPLNSDCIWIAKFESYVDSSPYNWFNSFSGVDAPYGALIAKANDYGFIISTQKASGTWIIKYDENGTYEWEKKIGDADCFGNDVILSNDGGYVIAGGNYSIDDNEDFWVVKTDTDGNAPSLP